MELQVSHETDGNCDVYLAILIHVHGHRAYCYVMTHTLVFMSAGNFLANAHELSVKGFKTVLDIDTVGVFNMSTAAYPALKAAAAQTGAPSSVIINISMTLHYGATHFQVCAH